MTPSSAASFLSLPPLGPAGIPSVEDRHLVILSRYESSLARPARLCGVSHFVIPYFSGFPARASPHLGPLPLFSSASGHLIPLPFPRVCYPACGSTHRPTNLPSVEDPIGPTPSVWILVRRAFNHMVRLTSPLFVSPLSLPPLGPAWIPSVEDRHMVILSRYGSSLARLARLCGVSHFAIPYFSGSPARAAAALRAFTPVYIRGRSSNPPPFSSCTLPRLMLFATPNDSPLRG
jgi:hypothetical protein